MASSTVLKLFLSLCIILQFFSLKEVQAQEQDGPGIWSELVAENNPMEINKTRELIQDLKNYFSNRTTAIDRVTLKRLNQLAWMGELNEKKCTETAWAEFLDILERWKYNKVNMRPYLLYQKDQIAQYCEGKTNKNWFKMDPRTWQQMFDLLFNSDGTPLGNEQTLDLLRKLVELKIDETNERRVKMRERLTRLLRLSELSKENCTKNYSDEITELSEEYESDTLNVVPYILYWKDRQTHLCTEKAKLETRNSFDTLITNRTELRDFYDRIFSRRKAEEMTPETTSQAIRQLLMSYKERTDRNSRRRAARLEKLVKLQNLTDERCRKESYDELVELYDFYEFDTVNIIPYLNSRKDVLANFCERNNTSNLFLSDPNDWKALHRSIYASDESESSPLGNQKTLEMLQQLLEIYKNRTDRSSRLRRNKVERLIAASELGREKCNRRSRSELEDLIDYNSPFTVNIVPYLENAELQQSKICRS